MRKIILALTVSLMLVLPLAVRAQEDESPAPPASPASPAVERKADPAALKLWDAARKRMFSNAAAGLTTFACKVTITTAQGDIGCSLKFAAPDTVEVALDSLPEALEPMRSTVEPRLEPQLRQVLTNRCCRDEFALVDQCHLAMKEGTEDTVVLTGFEGPFAGRTMEIRFGADGLPAELHHAAQSLTIGYRYVEKDGKLLVAGWDLRTQQGPQTLDWTYEKMGAYWVVKTFTSKSPMGGTTTLVTADHVVNGKALAPPAPPKPVAPEKEPD